MISVTQCVIGHSFMLGCVLNVFSLSMGTSCKSLGRKNTIANSSRLKGTGGGPKSGPSEHGGKSWDPHEQTIATHRASSEPDVAHVAHLQFLSARRQRMGATWRAYAFNILLIMLGPSLNHSGVIFK